MNLKERIATLDPKKADKYQNAFWDFADIGCELEIPGLYDVHVDIFNHIKEFPLHTWRCTDTIVGWKALFLNDEFICITYQPARKSDTKYFWASKEAINKTHNYLISVIPKKETGFNILSEKDLAIDPENFH